MLNDERDVQYPIFWKDREGYMYKVRSLNGFEVNDVEEVASAWDTKGRPLYISLSGERKQSVEIELISVDPRLDQLKAAMRKYAIFCGLDADFESDKIGVEQLFDLLKRK